MSHRVGPLIIVASILNKIKDLLNSNIINVTFYEKLAVYESRAERNAKFTRSSLIVEIERIKNY